MQLFKKWYGRVGVIVLLSISIILALSGTDVYKEASNSLQLYNTVFRHIFANYADPIKAEQFTEASIKAMVKTLDPYTVLLTRDEKEPLETLTKGTYGGVGIRISMRKDTLTVISPMEGGPAERAQIFPGDQILKVDSVKTAGLSLTETSKMIRGEIGTKVILTIRRPGVPGVTEYTLTRENINVTDVSYTGLIDEHIGYIRLAGFSKGAAAEVRGAISELKREDKNLQALILDLRGNPGGLLSEALSVAELFSDRGDTLLITKGRVPKANRVFIARTRPFLEPEVKLAVLVNRGSASASEIVSGVIQDLDRGIVLGTPSFGKGLVQTVFKVDKDHSVKVTTAKYYIPSGRLIQKPDYLNNPAVIDQTVSEDSVYFSRNGRRLKGGGGIMPDIEVKQEQLSPYVRELWRQNMFYAYAIHYKFINQDIAVPVTVTDDIVADFRAYLQANDFHYRTTQEKEIRDLEKELKADSRFEDIKIDFDDLYTVFDNEKSREFDNNIEQIKNGLASELATLAGGLKERVKTSLYSDPVLEKAVATLKDDLVYDSTLGFAVHKQK